MKVLSRADLEVIGKRVIRAYVALPDVAGQALERVDIDHLCHTMLSIMMEQKKPEVWNLTIPMDKIKKYFPRSYTPQRMEEVIFKLLDAWQKKRQRDQSR